MSSLRRSLTILFVLATLQVLDVITTNLTPDLEANPVTVFFFVHFGALWWLPKLAICLLIAAGTVMAGGIPRRPLLLVTTGYTIVVWINVANVVAIYWT